MPYCICWGGRGLARASILRSWNLEEICEFLPNFCISRTYKKNSWEPSDFQIIYLNVCLTFCLSGWSIWVSGWALCMYRLRVSVLCQNSLSDCPSCLCWYFRHSISVCWLSEYLNILFAYLDFYMTFRLFVRGGRFYFYCRGVRIVCLAV